jgi:hypothetical protein
MLLDVVPTLLENFSVKWECVFYFNLSDVLFFRSYLLYTYGKVRSVKTQLSIIGVALIGFVDVHAKKKLRPIPTHQYSLFTPDSHILQINIEKKPRRDSNSLRTYPCNIIQITAKYYTLRTPSHRTGIAPTLNTPHKCRPPAAGQPKGVPFNCRTRTIRVQDLVLYFSFYSLLTSYTGCPTS